MAEWDNYREIQKEYLRRTEFSSDAKNRKRPFREYHTAESITEKMQRLSKPLENGCREWLGKIGTGGYAHVDYRKNGRRLHRKAATVAYELKNGSVPVGKEVSHLCDNRRCVNPDHLIAETHSENIRRRKPFPRFKGHRCKRGHPLDGVKLASNGGCPICEKVRVTEWKERTGYDFNKYRAANKDRINAQRRARRKSLKGL
jgi:hypothetical protein